MEQYLNIGSVSLYEDDGSGNYTYSKIFKPQDYVGVDATMRLSNNMNFGASMDIQDDRIIIGCPNEEPYDSLGAVSWQNRNSGSVYVFNKDTGKLIQKIIPDNTPEEWTVGSLSGKVLKKQNFGYSLAAGDDYIVIGAPGYVDNIGSTEYAYSGRVYVYKWNSGTSEYDLSYTISPASSIENNRFGDTVLVEDNTIVIANSPKPGSTNSGFIRQITLNSTRTSSINDVKITNTHSSWQYNIAIDSGRIAIGLPDIDTIKIYTIANGITRLECTIIEDRLKDFNLGSDLHFDGDKLIIGSPNGYYGLGVVLRLSKVAGNYTLV